MGNSKINSVLTDEALNICHQILSSDAEIAESRKKILHKFSDAVKTALNERGIAEITVICTHNSRRSHIGQVMLKLAALHYHVKGIRTFSGGTEATALNHRVVNAFEDMGMPVQKLSEGENPKYYIPLEKDDTILDIHFSKPYDNSYNPQKGFIAVMVCNSADEACPVVLGSAARISLPYIDPKISDGTKEELSTYKNKILEIGKEMFYVISKIKKSGT